jgi:hypothetical protein
MEPVKNVTLTMAMSSRGMTLTRDCTTVATTMAIGKRPCAGLIAAVQRKLALKCVPTADACRNSPENFVRLVLFQQLWFRLQLPNRQPLRLRPHRIRQRRNPLRPRRRLRSPPPCSHRLRFRRPLSHLRPSLRRPLHLHRLQHRWLQAQR